MYTQVIECGFLFGGSKKKGDRRGRLGASEPWAASEACFLPTVLARGVTSVSLLAPVTSERSGIFGGFQAITSCWSWHKTFVFVRYTERTDSTVERGVGG